MAKTRLIVTGGTLDKNYNPLSGELVFGKTHVGDMLGRARFTGETVIQSLFMKDSLDITDEEREMIVNACEDAEENKIVITHGTDTMVETAQSISRSSKIGEKAIVLTGAMIPYSMGESSDALFNLGAALAYAEVLPSGVYVAMNGQPFLADNVVKNREIGMFTTLR